MLIKQKSGLNGYLIVPVIFNAKSLWYEPKEISYDLDVVTNELRWDFVWNPIFTNYDNRNIVFENDGHIEAPFRLELNGEVISPVITIIDESGTRQLDLTGLTIQSGESFVYDTKDTSQEIYKTDGTTKTNLFSYLNPNFINFFKLSKGVSTIRLTASAEITSGKLTVYNQYVAV